MVSNNRFVQQAFVVLAMIAVVIALNGVAYRAVLWPTVASSAKSETTGPSYRDICTRPRGMSDAEFEEYVRRFERTGIVNWRGWAYGHDSSARVVDVASELPGDLTWRRDIELLGVPEPLARDLRLGQPITFSGTIRHVKIWDSICKPMIENVKIVVG